MTYGKMKNMFQLIDTSDAIKNNRQRYKNNLANGNRVEELQPVAKQIVDILNSSPNTVVSYIRTNELIEQYTIKGLTNLIQINTSDFTEVEFLKTLWSVVMEDYGGYAVNMAAITISSRLQPIHIVKNDNITWAICQTIFWKSYNKTENDLYLSIIKTVFERLFKIKGK